MGGSPKNTTSTQKVEPWDAAKPYYERLYGQAEQAFNATNRAPYAGELYAAPNATQQQALDMYRGMAGTIGAQHDAAGLYQGVAPVNQLAQDTISGKYLTPDSNPYIKAAYEATVRPIEQRLTRSILPSIQDQSIAQGAFGGAGNGVQNALATSDFTQQALDVGSRMYDANYQRERQLQMMAPQLFAQAQGLVGQADQLSLLPAQLLDQAGSQQQSWEQAALDAALQRYNIDQAAPWAGLGEWGQILNGGGFSSAGTTSRAPGSGTASFLQGAAGTAALLNSTGAMNWLTGLFRGGGGGDPFANLAYGTGGY